jgi:hypothetical protein
MAAHAWCILGILTQTDAPDWNQTLMQHLASSVHELNVPASVLERMQSAASAAVCRSFQRDNTRAVQVTVSAQQHQEAKHHDRTWGFFLIEKSSDGAVCQHIAVQLYADECTRQQKAGNP